MCCRIRPNRKGLWQARIGKLREEGFLSGRADTPISLTARLAGAVGSGRRCGKPGVEVPSRGRRVCSQQVDVAGEAMQQLGEAACPGSALSPPGQCQPATERQLEDPDSECCGSRSDSRGVSTFVGSLARTLLEQVEYYLLFKFRATVPIHSNIDTLSLTRKSSWTASRANSYQPCQYLAAW